MKAIIKTTAIALLLLLAGSGLFAQSPGYLPVPSLPAPTQSSDAKTNGVVKLSPAEKAELNEFQKRNDALRKMGNSRPTDWDAYETAVRAKMKDFPDLLTRDIYGNAYGDFTTLIWHYATHDPAKARALAQEVAGSQAPEHYRLKAAGILKRFDSMRKPIAVQFTALDGRNVGSTALNGKVVLLDFWATTCPGCVRDAPALKAAYEKLHSRGFEIIGITSDSDKKAVLRFVKKQNILWSQYFEGKPNTENRFTVEFGIYGIPHLMLLDKQGRLRFDGVLAGPDLEEKISLLLAE